MIAAWWSVVAVWASEPAADLAWERARAAVDLGHGAPARAFLDPWLEAELDDSVRFHRLYLESAAADGLAVQARAAYDVLAVDHPEARLAWTWHAVVRDGGALRELVAERHPEVATSAVDLAFGWAAYARKEYPMAAVVGQRVDSADGADLRLHAEMRLEGGAPAVAHALDLRRRWPERPDALVGLWLGRLPAPEVARARKRIAAEVAQQARHSDDPVLAWRAYRFGEHARDARTVKAAVDRLTAFGEVVPERVAVDPDPFGAAEREANDLLSADLHVAALGVAERASVLAVRPAQGDRSRIDARRTARELASAEAIRGAASTGLKRRSEALVAFTLAALLDPATWEPARLRWRREPVPEVAIERAVADALLDGSFSKIDEALALCASVERPGASVSRARLAALLEKRGHASRAKGDDDAALVVFTEAALIEPSGERHRARAELFETRGEVDAAFVAFALAQAHGASNLEAALARTWIGPGAWAPIAVAAVEAYWAGVASEVLAQAASPRPRIGSPIPDFSFETPDGRKTLESLRGRVVVVTLWASWCGPCLSELPAYSALARKLATEGEQVEFVAVSVDERMLDYERARRRSTYDGLAFSWNPELGSRFGVSGIPSSWVIDAEGNVRFHHVGFAAGDERVLEREIRSLVD